MAEPNEQPKTVSDNPQPATDKPTELPHFQSPPLSPELKAEPVRERIAPQPLEPMRPFASAPKLDPQKAEEERIFALPHTEVPKASMPRFSVPSYLQRTASLAATVLIAAGLRLRAHAPLIAAAVNGVIAIAILAAHDLLPFAPEWQFMLGGAVLLAASALIAREMRGRATGVVITPDSLTRSDDDLQLLATIAAQPQAESAPAAAEGGRFGGAGSTGKF